MDFLKSLADSQKLIELIRSGGYVVLAAIIFSETGLLIGFFLPGDSLLFLAGFVTAQGYFNLGLLMLLLSVMAILGDATGYAIGKWFGEPLYAKKDTWWFKRKHLLAAKEYYEKHGGKTIFLARFAPFLRTFAPVVAGIAKMTYTKFASYNIVGGISWICSMLFLGYWMGGWPIVQRNLKTVELLIVILSVSPIVIEYYRHKKKAHRP
jgi:membrane-associated protein